MFGEVNWSITKALSLTSGATYYNFDESRKYITSGFFSNLDNKTNTTKSNGVSPRAIQSYEVDRGVKINLQAAKGFRLGGVNHPLNANVCSAQDRAIFGGYQTYGDENLWNYEAGIEVRRGGVTFNAAAFYNDIHNLQVMANSASCGARIVINAPKAHSEGIEWELNLRPVPALQLGVNGSVMSSKFDSTVIGSQGMVAEIQAGSRLPTVPKFQVAALGEYDFRVSSTVKGFLSAEYQHTGSVYSLVSDEINDGAISIDVTSGGAITYGGIPAGTMLNVNARIPTANITNLTLGFDFADGFSTPFYVRNPFNDYNIYSVNRELGGLAVFEYNVGHPRSGEAARARPVERPRHRRHAPCRCGLRDRA